MTPSVLIAGIGNIFNRDDAFGVEVARKLAASTLPGNVCVREFGIRGFDLTMALLEPRELTILVDAMQRGRAPGTLYAIEPDLDSLGREDSSDCDNAHSLHPLAALAAAKSLGAPLGRVLVVGCEPAMLEDDSGTIGLTEVVAAAVGPAIEMIGEYVKAAAQAGRPASLERQIA